ncbi:hypothetical protein ACOME3_009068 [Neoechinorhynchus agilis]
MVLFNYSLQNYGHFDLPIVNVTFDATDGGKLVLRPLSIGRTKLIVWFGQHPRRCLRVASVIEKSRMDYLFDLIVIILVSFMSLLTGMLLDIEVVHKRIAQTPFMLIACCILEYLSFPLIIFALCRLFDFRPLVSAALFTTAASPISTKGNHWSIMFNADVELSVCLTFLSTMLSVVAMPAWIYSLGRLFPFQFKIPILRLGQSILTLFVPYVFGILINEYLVKSGGNNNNKTRENLRKCSKIALFISMLFFVTMGVYVSLPLFKLLSVREALIIPTFQWAGALLLYLSASACRLPQKQAVAIGLTCCYPNIGLAFLVVRHNLPAPETHIASAVVLIIAATGGLPLWILYPIHKIITIAKSRRSSKKHRTAVYLPVEQLLSEDKRASHNKS